MVKTHWVDYVKQAAVEAMEAKKVADYMVGVVISASPLKIKISQSEGLEITEDFLHLSRNVTDYEIEVSIKSEYGWKTKKKGGGSDAAAFEEHDHDIELGRKKITVHSALKEGEKVLLFRQYGGQDFIILDRVVEE